MPNKTVEALMDAVDKMHLSLVALKSDVQWLKRGMIGIYASVGLGLVTIVTTLLMRR